MCELTENALTSLVSSHKLPAHLGRYEAGGQEGGVGGPPPGGERNGLWGSPSCRSWGRSGRTASSPCRSAFAERAHERIISRWRLGSSRSAGGFDRGRTGDAGSSACLRTRSDPAVEHPDPREPGVGE